MSKIVALSVDPEVLEILNSAELGLGEPAVISGSLGEVLDRLRESPDFLVVVDGQGEAESYMAVVRKVRRTAPESDIFVIGGPKSAQVARDETSQGVDYFFPRPIEAHELEAKLAHAVAIRRVKNLAGIMGRSLGLRRVLETVVQIAPTEVPVLIQGESGVGKELVARAVHATSRRSKAAFEAINVGSLADGVLESELFGHERGAFTGAVQRRAGLFQRADGGTIFLDEVGEMSANMQVRLLRAIETGEVLRVGGRQREQVDTRLVSATNRDLEQEVQEGGFRSDLYYRLRVVLIEIPPLRERGEDIRLLAQRFLKMSNSEHGTRVRGFRSEALVVLESYSWPGNIRELKNAISSASVLAGSGKIGLEHLPKTLLGGSSGLNLPVAVSKSREEVERELIYTSLTAIHQGVQEILHYLKGTGPAGGFFPGSAYREIRPADGPSELAEEEEDDTLSTLERNALEAALQREGGNRRKAAKRLGISERTLYRKIKEYDL